MTFDPLLQPKSLIQLNLEQEQSQQDKEQSQIVELGRIFEMAIDNFIKTDTNDISGKIVLGACDYVMKTYKERMSALGENYGRLKRIIETEGIKIREPYANDGIPPRGNN